MTEDIVGEPQSESITEFKQSGVEAVKKVDGFDIGYGLSSSDVPTEITPGAAKPLCDAHPDGSWRGGFGYAGGGFGAYKVCVTCGTIFGKTAAKDGNQA